jgi:hypothetical protein
LIAELVHDLNWSALAAEGGAWYATAIVTLNGSCVLFGACLLAALVLFVRGSNRRAMRGAVFGAAIAVLLCSVGLFMAWCAVSPTGFPG